MTDDRRYAEGVQPPGSDDLVGWRVVNEAGEIVAWGPSAAAELTSEGWQLAGVDDGRD